MAHVIWSGAFLLRGGLPTFARVRRSLSARPAAAPGRAERGDQRATVAIVSRKAVMHDEQ
jgi:hypothetical protein